MDCPQPPLASSRTPEGYGYGLADVEGQPLAWHGSCRSVGRSHVLTPHLDVSRADLPCREVEAGWSRPSGGCFATRGPTALFATCLPTASRGRFGTRSASGASAVSGGHGGRSPPTRFHFHAWRPRAVHLLAPARPTQLWQAGPPPHRGSTRRIHGPATIGPPSIRPCREDQMATARADHVLAETGRSGHVGVRIPRTARCHVHTFIRSNIHTLFYRSA